MNGFPVLRIMQGLYGTQFETQPDGTVKARLFIGSRESEVFQHEPFDTMDEAARWASEAGYPVPSRYETAKAVGR